MKNSSSERIQLNHRKLIRWLIISRVVIFTTILTSGIIVEFQVGRYTLSLIGLLVLTYLFTLVCYWLWKRGFRLAYQVYPQILFDTMLVTIIICYTGGVGSDFTSLYVLTITGASLLLRRSGGLIAATASGMAYGIVGLTEVFQIDLPIISNGFSGVRSSRAVFLEVFLYFFLFYFLAFIITSLVHRLEKAGHEKAELEKKLHRLKINTSDILMNIASGVLTSDLSSKIIYINEYGSELLEFGEKELIGSDLREVLADRSPMLLSTITKTIKSGRGMVRFEATLQKSNGTKVFLGVTTSLLRDIDGEKKGVTAIFQDISSSKKFEEVSRQKERLEAVAELSASMAHEIKNPLASIRSSVELLSHGLNVAGEDQRLMDLILRESDRLSQLLNDFLDFARIKVSEWKAVFVDKLFDEVLIMLRNHPDYTTDIKIDTSDIRQDHQVVYGDKNLLKQIFFNLLLNSVQAIENHGLIRISYSPCESLGSGMMQTQTSYLNVTIEDNGTGINEEHLPHLFNPFFTTKKSGSGLGLSVVHRIVEAHYGKITIETKSGKGTKFHILLPTDKQKSALPENDRSDEKYRNEEVGQGTLEETELVKELV